MVYYIAVMIVLDVKLEIYTLTNRPKSVSNTCVIEEFGGVLELSIGFFKFSIGVRQNRESIEDIRRAWSVKITTSSEKRIGLIK